MRRVKVAAAFLCFALSGALGGVTFSDESNMPVASMVQGDLIAPLTAESCEDSSTSIGTTITSETTARATVLTAAATTEVKKPLNGGKHENARSAKGSATELIASLFAEMEMTATKTSSTATTVTTTTTATAEELPAETTYAFDPDEYETTSAETTTCVTEWYIPETEETVPAAETTSVTTATTAAPEENNGGIPEGITEHEYVMLCNVVGHEYGSDYVPVEEKALVVEVIMNRVHHPDFPDTIYEVLTQKNQFSGIDTYIENDSFDDRVTDSVIAAVDLYFADPSQFDHGYLYFNGDGYWNYFRTEY